MKNIIYDYFARRHLRRSLLKKYPARVLVFELTNTCNLHCLFCPTGSACDTRAKGMMNFEDFKRVMDECAFLVDSVALFGAGEPLLHPEFIKFVRYLSKEKKKKVIVFTNGMFLRDSRAIVASGLNDIFIACDGLTAEQHSRYRRGADLTQVLTNVKNLVAAKRKSRLAFPKIFLDAILSCHTESIYDDLIALAKELGVDGVRFTGIRDDIHHTNDWFPKTERFKPKPRPIGEYLCKFKGHLAGFVTWNGDLLLCCMSLLHEKPVVKGNAFRSENLISVFNSENYYEITRNAGCYPFCSACSFVNYEFYNKKIVFRRSILERWGELLRHPFKVLNRVVQRQMRTK